MLRMLGLRIVGGFGAGSVSESIRARGTVQGLGDLLRSGSPLTKTPRTPSSRPFGDIVISFFHMEDEKFRRLEAGVSARAQSIPFFNG
jgi:hypothetical protein